MMSSATDIRFMSLALNLARRGLGQTAPNPSVGCVIVKSGQVLAAAHTQKGGRPHAETMALTAIPPDIALHDATLYVTLEPCCHYGQTGPCTEAIIKAGIKKVVVAIEDPDPRVAGKGILALKEAGLEVVTGVLQEEAAKTHQGFFSVIQKKRPFVTLKLATTLDGKIATAKGESKWITGKQARNYGHLLRAQHDAIMVGITTVLRDDPMLTCRLPGLEDRSPLRIVIDSNARLPLDSKLILSSDRYPVFVIVTEAATDKQTNALAKAGATILHAKSNAEGRVDLSDALRLLAETGITRLFTEGGATLAASLIKAKLIDQLIWIQAPLLLGNDAKSAIPDLSISQLTNALQLQREEKWQLGPDLIQIFSPIC